MERDTLIVLSDGQRNYRIIGGSINGKDPDRGLLQALVEKVSSLH